MLEEANESQIVGPWFGCTCNSEKVIFCFNKRTGQKTWSCSGNCFKEFENNYSPTQTHSVQVASQSAATQTEDKQDELSTSSTSITTDVCGVDSNQYLSSLFTNALRVCQKVEENSLILPLNFTQSVTAENVIYPISDADEVDLQPVSNLDESKRINYNKEQDEIVCEVAVEQGSVEECHAKTNGKKNLFVCIHCDKVFKKQVLLTRHQDIHQKESEEKKLVWQQKGQDAKDGDDIDGDNDGSIGDGSSIVDDEQEIDENPSDKAATYPRRQHHNRSKGHYIHKCDHCEQSFTNKRYYTTHIKVVHTTSKPLKCSHCKQIFKSDKSLASHEKRHNEEELKCVLCVKVLRSRYDFENHLLTHPKQKSFKCDTCNKVLKSAHCFAKHQARHKELRCKDCGKVSKTEESLTKHQLVHEKSPDPPQPRISSREYTNSDKVCTPSEFKSRVRTHVKKRKVQVPFECTFCGKLNDSRGSHERHLRKHTKEKPFKCTFEKCEKAFAGKADLRVHIRRHTGEKPFKCERCGKAFVKKWNLDEHLRTHTGARPYKCEFCEQSFGFKNVLKVHLAQHTGEKPHKCPHCSNKYVKRALLKMHLVSHSGQKPYKCLQCDKAFVYKSGLTDHLQIHTAG